MKIRVLLTICLTGLTITLSAQKEDLSADKPKQISEKAEEFIFDGKFDNALELYKNLLKKNPEDYDLNFKVGFCLLNSSKGRYNAIEYLKKSISEYNKINKNKLPFFAGEYYLARAYQMNYEFDEAISEYQSMKNKVLKKRIIKEIDNQIAVCEKEREMYNNPAELIVTKLGAVNSKYSDHSPVLSADESVLIFTSKRAENTGGLQTKDGEYYEDIYIYDKKKGIHAKPENIGQPINTEGHEADCGLSVDGQQLFIYKSSPKDEGDIYESKLVGNKWTKPEKLNNNINTKKREVHASISADGKYLYFSSNRKGGKGGMDIWVSEKTQDGDWGKARNLGSPINTDKDEEGPFIHPDGKTLYFSSDGHPGMGGMDVFYSIKQTDGSWSEPVNLGFPLNTVDDDVFYFPSADGKRGFYSSQSGGKSSIYTATLYNQADKILTLVSGAVEDCKVTHHTFDKDSCTLKGDTVIFPNKRIFIGKNYFQMGDSVTSSVCDINEQSVDIYDSVYKVPDQSNIYVLNADNKQLENIYSPNILSGKYLFVLNDRKDYKIYYESENHIFDTKDISLKSDSSFRHIHHNAQLDTMIAGKIRKSKKVGFKENSDKLNNFTSLEMELLSDFLKKYQNLKVNISAYDYLTLKLDPRFYPPNFKYGAKREKALTDCLLSKGIDSSRIYKDLSPNSLTNDSIEYTIYDNITLKQAIAEREDRTKSYEDALVAAKKEQEEILKDYGLISKTDTFKIEICDMQFEINQCETRNYDQNITTLASYLKENPESEIEIDGYTDLQGTFGYNKNLARKRAQFVEKNLLTQGVSQAQIVVKNYNIANPIAKNKAANGEFLWNALPYNRRVEIKILEQGRKKKLAVKTIEVPEQYKIGNQTPINNQVYSINIITSDSKLNFKQFKTLKNVKERKASDNTYIYYSGEYKTEEAAQKDLQTVKKTFPNAIIFIKDF
jgi:outer membrane protein OmpA-like peptidoglycan-associated protein